MFLACSFCLPAFISSASCRPSLKQAMCCGLVRWHFCYQCSPPSTQAGARHGCDQRRHCAMNKIQQPALETVLEAAHLKKTFIQGRARVEVLCGAQLCVYRGEK